MVPLDEILKAQSVIKPFLHRTPVFTSRHLSTLSGAEVILKAELFQKTGSFKPRGAFNKLKHLTAEEKSRGIVTVSAGNHAQAVAFATSMEKIPCVVVMPATAPPIKVNATKGYGAEVILHPDVRTIFDRTEEVRVERGATLLHPFDDPLVVAGQGTVGLEIFEDVPDIDVAIVGIGGGALISGIALALKYKNPSIRVIGVEPEGAPTMLRALEEGAPVRLEKIQTIADGLAAPYAGKLNVEIVQKYVDEIVTVTDAQMIDAIKILLERAKLLVEPAGAASVAALLSGKVPVREKKVVVVLSGGNVDLGRLKEWLS
jgi:threonine dehydratase